MSRPVKIVVPGGLLLALTETNISGDAGIVPLVEIDASNPGVYGGLTRLPGDDVSPTASAFIFNGFATTIDIASDDDNSGVDFLLTGYDIGGNPISETITGPDDSHVNGAQRFHIVTSIVATAAYSNITIRNGYLWHTEIIRPDYDREYWNMTVQVTTTPATGTMPWNVWGSAWPIPRTGWVPGTIPRQVLIDGSAAPVNPNNIVQAFQQIAFPLTALYMDVTALGVGIQTDLYTLEVIQQGVRA